MQHDVRADIRAMMARYVLGKLAGY